jgi:hypothetical protein
VCCGPHVGIFFCAMTTTKRLVLCCGPQHRDWLCAVGAWCVQRLIIRNGAQRRSKTEKCAKNLLRFSSDLATTGNLVGPVRDAPLRGICFCTPDHCGEFGSAGATTGYLFRRYSPLCSIIYQCAETDENYMKADAML